METGNTLELPPEIWSCILSIVDDLGVLFRSRRVSKLFNDELKKRDPLEIVKDVWWDAGT